QLSLAIGREGQNARLAAKLTGWRIDIKSLTEAAQDSLNMLDHEAVDKSFASNKEFVDQIKHILDKKNSGRPVTAEDYLSLSRLVNNVEGRIIASRASAHDEIRKARAAIKKRIPQKAWDTDIIEFNLMHRIHNVLVENGITSVGAALYQLELGDMTLLALDGFGDKALEDLKKAAKVFQETLVLEVEKPAAEEVVAEEELVTAEAETAVAEDEDEAEEAAEVVAEAVEEAEEAEAEEAVAEEELVTAEAEAAVAEEEDEAEEEEDDEE
ncbi:MAG: hypothetical protein KDE51_09035, partial [Anaerolineales bacterium]|nr:hypothetical protein [Anaerolineales bacterium]